MLILIQKNLPCEIQSVESDGQGCFLTASICLGSRDLIISNVYAPNSPGKHFFRDLTTRLLKSPPTVSPHTIGGDFNSILHPTDDRSVPKRQHKTTRDPDPTHFASAMNLLHLTDLWRLFHPTDREFTSYSSLHNVFTVLH